MNSSPPRVLVLLAAYNGEAFIEDQIQSILNQKHALITLAISDNNSTDNTEKKIRKFKNKIIFFKNKQTKGSANNFYFLVKKFKNIDDYDYVAFSDQDDIFLLNKFVSQIKLMREKKAFASSSSILSINRKNNLRLIPIKQKITESDYIFEGGGQGCTFVFDVSVFSIYQKFIQENFNLVSNFYFHDWLLYIICRTNKIKWLFIEHPYTLYRQHENNLLGNRYTINGLSLRIKRIISGWYKAQIRLAIQIVQTKTNDNNKFLSLLYADKRSGYGSIKLMLGILANGRRSLIDNVVLIIGVLIGKV